jgi:RNA polymerase sigma-70 factor (ECF subfamily)
MVQRFDSTAWSVIVAAQGTDSAAAHDALQVLCGRYWPPLYAYLRRRGYAREEAEDLTQEFFARLLARDFLRQVRPELGRFRTFLLACLDHFLQDEWGRQSAARRGGGTRPLPLDLALAEERYAPLMEGAMDPRMAFDRQWAETVLDNAALQLEEEYRRAAQAEVFQVLRGYLGRGEDSMSCAAAGERLGMSEGAVRVAVHRLRKRFAALTRAEVSQTVEGVDAVQEELSYLIRVMGGRPCP